MGRKLIRVDLELDTIKCHDEGDGWGSAEPYLWTVFFKVDGATVQVTDALKLSGPPTVETTPGSHGNLGDTDVDEGDTLTIPSSIGEFETILSPIPGPPSIPTLEDFGGVVGVVAVLMEEDNVTDDGAEAGHAALNAAVRDAIQAIINTRDISNQDVTEEDIKGFTDAVAGKIKDAIKEEQNFFENVWSWLNPDDTIGTKVFLFRHDDLDPSTVVEFSHRWENEGDWEIFGHISSSVLCPASAAKSLVEALLGKGAAAERSFEMAPDSATRFRTVHRADREATGRGAIDLEPLRQFRDGDFRNLPGLARWFEIAERHSARLTWRTATNPELAQSLRGVLDWGSAIASHPHAVISDEHIESARALAVDLSGLRSRRARIDASRVLEVLPLLKGKTNRQAMDLLGTIHPARHPSAGLSSLRVLPKSPRK